MTNLDQFRANEIIEILLEGKADINKTTPDFKNTTLHFACQHSQELIIDHLLKNVFLPSK